MSRPASVFAPAGVQAEVLSELAWVLIIGAAAIFIGVMALLAWAVVRRGSGPAARVWVLGGGVAFPVVVLTALLLYTTVRTAGLEASSTHPGLVVGVVGRLWWWELHYADPAVGRHIVTANELRIPVGREVQLGLQSRDVIHSLWIPELGGKMDLVPGRVNRLVITATQPGSYRGQCAEFCGEQHARMGLHVIAMPAGEFDAWLVRQAELPVAPARAQAGREAFARHGCPACHAVDPEAGAESRGPNLAHVSSRLHLGAGAVPNGPGAYKRWLKQVQQVKPGAQMPSYAHLDDPTLDALAVYLESLR